MKKKISNKNLAVKIIELVGGKDNIKELYNCQTRVRFHVHDENMLDKDAINATDGILGLVVKGGEWQFVVGGKAAEVCAEIKTLLNYNGTESTESADEKKNEKLFNRFISFISGVFLPIIPALLAAGMLKCIVSILTLAGVDSANQTIQIMTFIADAGFFFLPILIANSMAKQLKCNPAIAMLLAGALLHPSFRSLVEIGDPVSFLGLPVKLVNYNQTVVPIMLTVVVQKYVEKLVNKVTPNVVKSFIVPTFTVLIVSPISLIILGPLGENFSQILGAGINWIYAVVPWLLPMIAGGLTPVLVMTGTHHALTPILYTNFALFGYDAAIYPAMFISNIAQAGATIGVAARSKDATTRSTAASTGVSCLLGITEPALYGVELQFGRPFVAALFGGAVGGLVLGINNVKAFVLGNLGLVSLPGYVSSEYPRNFMFVVISILVAFTTAFIVSFILGQKDKYVK